MFLLETMDFKIEVLTWQILICRCEGWFDSKPVQLLNILHVLKTTNRGI